MSWFVVSVVNFILNCLRFPRSGILIFSGFSVLKILSEIRRSFWYSNPVLVMWQAKKKESAKDHVMQTMWSGRTRKKLGISMWMFRLSRLPLTGSRSRYWELFSAVFFGIFLDEIFNVNKQFELKNKHDSLLLENNLDRSIKPFQAMTNKFKNSEVTGYENLCFCEWKLNVTQQHRRWLLKNNRAAFGERFLFGLKKMRNLRPTTIKKLRARAMWMKKKSEKKTFFLFYNFRKSLLNSTISLNDRFAGFCCLFDGLNFLLSRFDWLLFGIGRSSLLMCLFHCVSGAIYIRFRPFHDAAWMMKNCTKKWKKFATQKSVFGMVKKVFGRFWTLD